MFTEIKELTIKVVNEDMIIYQIENINKEIEIIRKEPNRNFGVITYNNWNRNSPKGLNTRFELAEE